MGTVLLRKSEAARRVGLSVRHLERLESAGRFPRRVRVSDRAAAWVESDVEDWIRDRVEASRAAVASEAA